MPKGYYTHKKRHGQSNSNGHESLAYTSWKMMKVRCLKPYHKAYKRYGGRGITVCDKWLKFQGFYEDMGDRPKDKTLDRIDGNGNYCKENCRWATQKEQSDNRFINFVYKIYPKKTRLDLYGLKPLGYTTIQSVADIYGCSKQCVHQKLKKGWLPVRNPMPGVE